MDTYFSYFHPSLVIYKVREGGYIDSADCASFFVIQPFSPTEPFKDNESVIQECLHAFATKDHIMEPAVYNMLKRYKLFH